MIALALFTCGTVHATERTVHFSGSALAQTSMLRVMNMNLNITCGITIANTGAHMPPSEQRFKPGSLRVLSIAQNPAGSFLSSVTSTPAGLSYHWHTSGSAPVQNTTDAPCSGNPIVPGDVCLIRWKNSSIPNSDSLGVCAGSFTVYDYSTDVPGSMTASGSIFIWQESVVMGGILSAAHYFSGTPLNNFTGVQLSAAVTPALQIGNSGIVARANQMNIYCASACLNTRAVSPASVSQCNELCGAGGMTGNLAPNKFPYPDQSMGWLHQSAPHVFGHTAGLTAYHSDSSTPAVPSSQIGIPSGTWSVASGKFAGGLVTEMVYGPLSSICSANEAYWTYGEPDFAYPAYLTNAGVGRGYVVAGNANFTDPPPQRLLCSQRHGREDLYFRTGSTVGFPVNGGLPF